MKKFYFLIIIYLISLSSISAQETKFDNGTINNNFDYIITKSNNYKDFKVVKKQSLYEIKKQVLDSLKERQLKINSLYLVIDKQKSKTTELEKTITSLNSSIEQANLNVDNINFIGFTLTKNSFKSIFWSLLILMTILLLFFIYKFKRSNTITQETKNLLIDIEKEYENHKKVALEREQKVMRKLQDELNKNRN